MAFQYSFAQNNTGSTSLIPNVTSNISLIMTPDLPENLGVDEFQNSMEPALQGPSDTIQTTVDDIAASNLTTIPQNDTLATPSSSDISLPTLDDNITIARQFELNNNTIDVLDDQDNISNTNSSTNTTSISNQNNSSQNTPTNETRGSPVGNESVTGSQKTTNVSTSMKNQIPSIDTPSNSTNGLEENLLKNKKSFTSQDGYSLSYPQDWNLTVYGNDTFIRTEEFSSDYYPLLSIFIQKVDPVTINNTQTLSQMFPIENVSNEIINSVLNNSKLQSNILLKYYNDLEYDILEPTQTGKYIIDGKPASSFKVYKSEDSYKREFIIVIIEDKIFNIEINSDDSLILDENAFEIEQSKQQIIDSIKWTNVTTENVTVSKSMDQEIANDNVTETNEIKSSISSSEDDLNITSSTHFFDKDNFKIVGEVLNSGPENRELVKVVITLYNENNNVIGTELSYTTPSDIISKQSAPFEIIISQGDVGNTSEIRSYKLFLTADVEKPSNSRESPSISGTTSSSNIPDSTNLNVKGSSISNLTSSNSLDMLMNLFKDTNSTVSPPPLQNDFARDNLPTNPETHSNPVLLTDNIVDASIVSGASFLTDNAYNPNPIEISMGQTVRWTNDDAAFHTVTSGLIGTADAGRLFDSGLAGPTALTSKGKTFEHTFDTAGEIDYHCTLHPAMVGKIIVR
jgi:plastocyanin